MKSQFHTTDGLISLRKNDATSRSGKIKHKNKLFYIENGREYNLYIFFHTEIVKHNFIKMCSYLQSVYFSYPTMFSFLLIFDFCFSIHSFLVSY